MISGIAGRTAATAATANHAAAGIWNPHATDRIQLVGIDVVLTTAGLANLGVLRNTARGTAGSTVTPAIQSDFERGIAPPSGYLLDLATYTVQPTLDSATAYIWRWNLPAAIGAGIAYRFPRSIRIPPGAGIVLVTPVAVIFPASDVTFWIED